MLLTLTVAGFEEVAILPTRSIEESLTSCQSDSSYSIGQGRNAIVHRREEAVAGPWREGLWLEKLVALGGLTIGRRLATCHNGTSSLGELEFPRKCVMLCVN